MGVCLKNVDMDWFKDESQAPIGYACISALYPSPERSRDRERVRRGISMGMVTAARLVKRAKDADNGPIYINVREAVDWLQSEYYAEQACIHHEKSQSNNRIASEENTTCDLEQATNVPQVVCDRLAAALERIAEALETIATDPPKNYHTSSGPLLHASTDGNE
jgi:hypothetical protein